MIKNIKDLEGALTSLKEENILYPSTVSDKMDAAVFNLSLKRIQDQINSLYEKIRITEEIDNFCHDYVIKEIEQKRDKIQESLKIIEDTSIIFQNKESVSILVPFKNTSELIQDRDGSAITLMNINNNILEPKNDVMANILLSNVTYKSNIPCYNNSYKNLVHGSMGMSFYSTPEPVESGVQEIITATLSTPQECNYISIQPINCKIIDVKTFDENRVEYEITPNTYFETKKISGIIFTIIAKNFTREFKTGNSSCYDNSGAFSSTNNIYDSSLDRATIKQIERSRENMEKKYIINTLEEKCDTWDRINRSITRKNILLAGEKNNE